VAAGADEVDVVFPWRAWQAGDTDSGPRLLEACRAVATGRMLKVILETGELAAPE
jgi:deoxyribose-phosphate aldolase